MKDIDRDFLEVQEDALLLDIVAARQDLSAFADDHVAQLLGAYTTDIDLGLEMLAHAQLPEAPAPVVPIAAASKRRRSGRFLIAATTAAVLLGTSGVAAAVTGDPLTPFRSVVRAVTGAGETPGAQSNNEDRELPEPAATEAEIQQALREVNQAVRDGDLEKAQQLLDQIRSDVNGHAELAPGLEHRLDNMQDKVDDPPGNPGGPSDPGTQKPNQPGEGSGKPNNGKNDEHANANTSHPDKPGQDNAGSNPSDKQPAAGDPPADSTGDGQSSDPKGNAGDEPGKPANSAGQTKGRPEKDPDKTTKAERAERQPNAGSTHGKPTD